MYHLSISQYNSMVFTLIYKSYLEVSSWFNLYLVWFLATKKSSVKQKVKIKKDKVIDTLRMFLVSFLLYSGERIVHLYIWS